MADRNRRGRNVDDDGADEPIEDVYDDFDDADVDDADLDEDEDEKPARRARAATATRSRARSRTSATPGIFGRIVRRLRETVAELQKVIWPTRKELLTYTTVVVIFVALIMGFVAGLDYGFARLMILIFGRTDA